MTRSRNGSSTASEKLDPPGRRIWLWLSLVLFAAVLAAPRPEGLPPAAHRLAATTVLMAFLWASQALPIAVTSLIPLAAYPALGIQSMEDVSDAYIDANIFLYLGGFIIALGIERWGLHRRMALTVVSAIGSSPRRIVLGFMLATAFVSMWVSNTATTMLMLPIASALLVLLIGDEPGETAEASVPPRGNRLEPSVAKPLGRALMLGIAHSASLGGLSTLVGTPTNIALLGLWRRLFPEAPEPSMSEWMTAFVPLAVAMLLTAFALLTWSIPVTHKGEELGARYFREQLRGLGRLSAGEWAMLIIFVTTALLWILRTPIVWQRATGETWTLLPGWGPLYEAFLQERLGVEAAVAKGAVHDTLIAMLMAVLMFVVSVRVEGEWRPLIVWTDVQRGLPWGILLLFGGGFAMAGAFGATGLSAWLGETLADSLAGVSPVVLVAAVCLLMTFLTEFTSNVATVSTFVPILASAAVSLHVDPRLLLIPATVTASCAFMLPIATPPNAIVFGTGRVEIGSMMWFGLWLNLAGVALVTLVTFVLLVPVLGISIDSPPSWMQ
jgi:sodium-dependent dicarboxylate transporter 2/3/5